MATIWNFNDTVADACEQMGIVLNEEVRKHMARDVEYRLWQLMAEAVKFSRHRKDTGMVVNDVISALRAMEVEPLYGYQTHRPLQFGEASLGPGQALYYLEDEEIDLEKLINAPLPKVPRDVAVTAHWLAIEGVQPQINQNPSNAEARSSESGPKGSTTSHSLAAIGGSDNSTVKPLVKHILSKELQIYFERVCETLKDEDNENQRTAALASLKTEPGLHQLLPYFVHYIRENITHNYLNLFTLNMMLEISAALLQNEHLFLEPYINAMIPSILTCLVSKRLGPETAPSLSSYPTRDLAASLIRLVCENFGNASHNLKPRLVRTFLKTFLQPNKPFATHYGSIKGLLAVGDAQVAKMIIAPNVKMFSEFIRDDILNDTPKRVEADACLQAIIMALKMVPEVDSNNATLAALGGGNAAAAASGASDDSMDVDRSEEAKAKMIEALGELVGEEIWRLGDMNLVKILAKTRPISS